MVAQLEYSTGSLTATQQTTQRRKNKNATLQLFRNETFSLTSFLWFSFSNSTFLTAC